MWYRVHRCVKLLQLGFTIFLAFALGQVRHIIVLPLLSEEPAKYTQILRFPHHRLVHAHALICLHHEGMEMFTNSQETSLRSLTYMADASLMAQLYGTGFHFGADLRAHGLWCRHIHRCHQ